MDKLTEIKEIFQNMFIDPTKSDGEIIDTLVNKLDTPSTETSVEGVSNMPPSDFVKPKRIIYTENGTEKTWDVVESHDSVAVHVFNVDTQEHVFVKQFRPAVWRSGGSGYVLELCAGLVDKDKPLVEIAREEILEELGYDVCVDHIEHKSSFRTSVGILGSPQHMFYAEVTNDERMTEGGGIHTENIEVIHVDHFGIDRLLKDNEITMGVEYALTKFELER